MSKDILKIEKLTKTSFAPYGQIVGLTDSPKDLDKPQRWSNISIPDFKDGKGVIDILYSNKRKPEVTQMERHRNSTQTFISLNQGRFLIVVAKIPGNKIPEDINTKNLKAFISSGEQGITLNAGVWHCSPIPIDKSLYFVLLHRSPDVDLDSQIINLKEIIVLQQGKAVH